MSSLREKSEAEANPPPPVSPPRDSRFWMVFVAGLIVDLLSALDLTAVSTALPTIVGHFGGSEFVWVGSAYALASTAILPTVGSLSSSIGRKPLLLAFIICFGIGSAISGASVNMTMLISGRVVQGLGGGGCLALTEIVYADLIPLPERGKFQGITAIVWALACAMGPPISGALAGGNAWRWLFYLNIPLCAISFIAVVIFLDVKSPELSFKATLKTLDGVGLFLIISSTISISIGLIRGGVDYPWTSSHILAPILVGFGGLVAFVVVEFRSEHPTVPPFILSNRTTLSGYIGTALHGVVSIAAIFYIPVYLQACKLDSAIHSGVDFLRLALIIPFTAILTGLSVQIIGRYLIQNYAGWILTIVGFALLTILTPETPIRTFIGVSIVLGTGLGIIWISTQFPILAPLPFSNNSHALGFFTFTRCLFQTWGTVIGGAILQNALETDIRQEVLATVGRGRPGLVYALIPSLHTLNPPILNEVQHAFATGLKTIWYAMVGVSTAGLVSCFMMRELELQKVLDDQWGLQSRQENATGDD